MSERTRVLQSTRCVLGGGEDRLRIEPARITVREGLIRGVDPYSEASEPNANAGFEFFDLGDRLLSPAFINGHTHLSMTAFRGIGGVEVLGGNVIEDLYYRLEATLEPEAVRAFSRVSAFESLLSGSVWSGTTTITGPRWPRPSRTWGWRGSLPRLYRT